jgi:hypothetical protein
MMSLRLSRRDDAFDDVVTWLARHRGNMVVDAAYKRLIATVH